MIPKKIHYCWFGRTKKKDKVIQCISSWRKFCPDYEVIEWNEDNFDVNQNGYLQFCYQNKKWAFLSDLARLMIVESEGGIYFDTDVELVRKPDELLVHDAFFGFESKEYVNTGLGFGSSAHGEAIKAMLSAYEPLLDGLHGVVGCPILNTQALKKMGLVQDGTLQTVAGAKIYPIEWLNPYDAPTGRIHKTKKTISIHWYAASWMSPTKRLRSVITRPLHRIFGINFLRRNTK